MAEQLETLVVRAQTGDREAYNIIVQRFQEMALAYAYAIVGDYELAEDARQEAFLGAYCDLLTLREPAAFPGWFRRIVRNHSYQLVRGRRRLLVPLEEVGELPSAGPAPDRALADREERDRVREALAALPAAEREVARLFYFEDRSLREIGELARLPVKTVKSRLHTARARLRQRLMEMVKKDVTRQARRGDRRPLHAAAAQAVTQFDEELKGLQAVLNDDAARHAVDLLCAKGRLLRFIGRMDEARVTFEDALGQPALKRNPSLGARLRAELGLNWVHVSDYDRACADLEAALDAIRRQEPNPTLEASILNGLGLCAWGRGELSQARDLYLEAAKISRSAACLELEATAANNLALLDWKLGQLEPALVAFKRCLAVWKKMSNRHDTALTLMNVGIIEENLGRLALARRHYGQALALAAEVGFVQVQAATQGNLANLALVEERWPEAFDAAARALELARAIGDRRSQAIALENQALACLGLMKIDRAFALVKEARRLAQAIGDRERLLSLELVEIEAETAKSLPGRSGLPGLTPARGDASVSGCVASGRSNRLDSRISSKQDAGASQTPALKNLLPRLEKARQEAETLGFAAELPRILRLTAAVQALLGDVPGAHQTLTAALAECRRQKNKPEERRLLTLQAVLK